MDYNLILFVKKGEKHLLREKFSFIFDKFTDPLTLPIEPLYEWIILGIIGIIAYVASFHIIGNMYDRGNINGGFLGSLFHWSIRFLIFVPIWFVVYWAIVIAQWIIANWFLSLCIICGLIVLVLAIIRVMHYINRRYKIL